MANANDRLTKDNPHKYLIAAGWEVHNSTWTCEGRFYIASGRRKSKEFNMEKALILEGYFCRDCTDKYWGR